MAQQSRKMQSNGRETREVTGANTVALGNRQASDSRDREEDGEPTANDEQGDTGETDRGEMGKDVTMSETTAQIKIGAATSND
jgi:hypothetical protein